MKETIVKCYCDYCNKEMSECEYKSAIKITIGVTVPNPQGGAGAYNGVNMILCDKCAENFGITKHKIHTGIMFPESRLLEIIKKIKKKIVDMFFKEDKEEL